MSKKNNENKIMSESTSTSMTTSRSQALTSLGTGITGIPSSQQSLSSQTQSSHKRPRLSDINAELTCILCNGYFIDATTISECLHSFCKSCIVKYLETNKCCPICETQVHGTKPLVNIRPDGILQDIVYKLIPDVFKNEMARRREFYSKHTEANPTSAEDRGEVAEHRMFYMPNDKISLSLEYGYGDNQMPDNGYGSSGGNESTVTEKSTESDTMKRYLLCPAGLSILHLKKFIVRKYGLPTTYRVDVMYLEDNLSEDYTLMDVAYIYAWRRSDPMRLFYRISERPIKRLKTTHPQTIESKSGSGSSLNNSTPNISNASNNSNNSVTQLQSKLVGTQASSCASHMSTATGIMTGAAPLPPSPALKTLSSGNVSNNSGATGVTSGKGSIATPKHTDISKSASTVNCALNTQPTAATPQGILKSKSTHMSASAVQTDEPPKKLRKILPNNSSATTPIPVPITTNINCANTTATTAPPIVPILPLSTSTSTSTVNSLRQCRIATDKSKLCSAVVSTGYTTGANTSANTTPIIGLSVCKTSSKEDTKCVTNDINDNGIAVSAPKKHCSRKSSAFDVRTLIGTKSPTLQCNRHSVEAMSGNECNDEKGINHKKTSSDGKSATQTAKQSKVNSNPNSRARELNRNSNRSTSSECSLPSTLSSMTGSAQSKKLPSNSTSVEISKSHSHRSTSMDKVMAKESYANTTNALNSDSSSFVPLKNTKSGAHVSSKQSSAKSLKTSQNDMSIKSSNKNKDSKSDSISKISIKPITNSKSETQIQSNPTQRQSNPLSPTSIRIKLPPPPPQKTSTTTAPTTATTSANKNSSKSSCANTRITSPLSTTPLVSDNNSKEQKQKQNQSIEMFGSKQSDLKKHLSDSKTRVEEQKPIQQICNQSISKSAVSQCSATKTKGASINQIVSKIASGVTAKSTSVNVTSTTPTLELNKTDTSATQQLSSRSNEVTPNEVNDDKVSTTTSESAVSSSIHKNQCQSESAIRATTSGTNNSGNLVIRISTKSHSVESLVSPKDREKSGQKTSKFEIKKDFSNSPSNTPKTNGSNTQIDIKNTKISTNTESFNGINQKNSKNQNQVKCLDSFKNNNSINNNNEEEDDYDDDNRRLVVDVPNEDNSETEVGTSRTTHEGVNHRSDNGMARNPIKANSGDFSHRSLPSSALTFKSMRTPSDMSTKLAINISSTTTLSANSAVLASPPPTPTPSPKSESDPCIQSDNKSNSSSPNGPLDLSMSTKKDRQKSSPTPVVMRAIYDIPPPKPKHCVNPAVLDKHRGLFPTTPVPNKQYASFKIMSTQSQAQGMRQSTGSPLQTTSSSTSPNVEVSKKNRSINSSVVSSNTTTGSNHSSNSSRHRSVSHSHHSSHHNHKNYSVITPDPHRYTSKLVIRNIGSPPSITSHFNYPTHH